MREALIAGILTMAIGGPAAFWAIVRVGTRKPTPAAARTNHPSTERRGKRP